MYRPFFQAFSRGVLLLALTAVPVRMWAQDSVDEAWKNLILEGTQFAADVHDNARAEQAFLKALHEAEHFGPGDVRVGATQNRLGMVYREEKKYSEAEASFRKALSVKPSQIG